MRVLPLFLIGQLVVTRNTRHMDADDPLVINGVPVVFPFTPYDCQRAYMHNVIEAIQTVCAARDVRRKCILIRVSCFCSVGTPCLKARPALERR